MFVDRAFDSEREPLKPPEGEYNRAGADAEDDRFRFSCVSARREDEVVQEMSQHEDGEVQRWKLQTRIVIE